MRILLLAVLASPLLGSAPAARFVPALTGIVWGTTTPAEGAVERESASLGIVFSDRELRLTVLVSAESQEGPGDGSSSPIELVPSWWNTLRIRFEPRVESSFPGPELLELRGADLKVRRSGAKPIDMRDHDLSSLRLAGDSVLVDLIVPAPAPGDYTLRLRMPDPRGGETAVETTVGTISSRRGHENAAVRRTWLRAMAKNEKTFTEFRKLQLELIELEPADWTLWEDLANRSLGITPPEETLMYYERAYEILKRSPEPTTAPMREVRQADEAFLTLFKRLYPLYAGQRETVALKVVRSNGVKTFKALDRSTGKPLGVIDPMQPSIPPR